MIGRLFLTAAAFLGIGLAEGQVWAAGCTIKFVDIPVTMSDLRATIPVRINDQPAVLAIDSGAFYSFISQPSAERLHLPMRAAPPDRDMIQGINGESEVFLTTINRLTIGSSVLPGLSFLVGGAAIGNDVAGLLGENILARGDVEYDFGHGMMRLAKPVGCGDRMLAYWDKTDPFSVIDIAQITADSDHIVGTALINGVTVRVLFDTGAPLSFLTLAAAKRAGITPASPGVIPAEASTGLGRGVLRTWIAPVKSFKIGDEEIHNTHLRVGEGSVFGRDMLIGTDFFLSHHIYVANSQQKMYFTYNGGTVFNLGVDVDVLPSRSATTSAPAGQEPATGVEPIDAAGFGRRGAASLARRDYGLAIADLTRAIALAPRDPSFLNQRVQAYLGENRAQLALEDLDLAVELAPADASPRVVRARIRLANAKTAEALVDLDAAADIAARQSELRLVLGRLYLEAKVPAKASGQFDLWLANHPRDAEKFIVMGEACWAKALAGQDLKVALEDCDAVLAVVPRTGGLLNSRGLVWLRLGRFEKAIADYNAALALAPKQAWSLYGRGLAKLKTGRVDAGKADIATALSIRPDLAEDAGHYGLGG
jgi:tetratricopeptide (TPR) repeat protein/predicted aspartyl protease